MNGASARGDTFLARADDTQLGLRVRDILYRDAEQYFEFGGFNDKEAAVSTAREATQKAVDDMQRTEAERQSFGYIE